MTEGTVTPVDVTGFLKGEEDAKWYKIPGTEAELQIRKIKPVTRRKIAEACTSQRVHRGQVIDKHDDKKFNQLMLAEAVVGWRNLVDDDGKEFPVTPENKVALDGNWPEFAALWGAVVGNESRIEDAIREAESKN